MTASTTTAHNAPAMLALVEAAATTNTAFGADVAQEALARFRATGLPTNRDEQWRYTSLKDLMQLNLQLPADDAGFTWKDEDQDRLAFGTDWAALIVFHNGHLMKEVSSLDTLPDGVHLNPIRGGCDSIPHSGPTAFSDLNTILTTHAMELVIDDDVEVASPIQFLFLNEQTDAAVPTIHSNRIVIRMGRNAKATVLENHTGPDGAIYLSNTVTECHLAENSSLSMYRLQRESETAHHVGRVQALQLGKSQLSIFTVATGAQRSRLDICSEHNGTAADTQLNGLFIARDQQHMDHHIEVDHQQPEGTSDQTFRGILSEKATGVFNGRVHVAVNAQKVDAQQSNRNLLLSRDASVNAKPELEVYADDVKCAHGTTIGELDPHQIFYLRTRGLAEAEAKDLLTFAFASDLVQRVELKPVAERLADLMSSRFSRVQNVEGLL